MPLLSLWDGSLNLDKRQIFVVLLPFLSAPLPAIPARLCESAPRPRPRIVRGPLSPFVFFFAQGPELTVQEFALEGVFVFGGWKCRGRVKLSALCLEWLVRLSRITLRGQKHPPGTGTPSSAEKGSRIAPPRRLGDGGASPG